MKQIIFIFLLLFSMTSFSQETIEIDGIRVEKAKLKGKRKISLDTIVYIDKTEKDIKKQQKQIKQELHASKKGNAFVLTSVELDRYGYEWEKYENSKIKFYDKDGKMKWERKMPDKQVFDCYVSEDGKFCTVYYDPMDNFPNSPYKNLAFFNDKGEKVFDDVKNVYYQLSSDNDLISYKYNYRITKNLEHKKETYTIDLRSGKTWKKKFDYDIDARRISSSGNNLVYLVNNNYFFYDRDGHEVLNVGRNKVGRIVVDVSADGQYCLSKPGSSEYYIYNLKTLEPSVIPYLQVEEDKNPGFNGGCFVRNSDKLVAFAAIFAPMKAMVIFFDFDGTYLGHTVFENIQNSFYSTRATLNEDGTIDIWGESHYYGNVTLPAIKTSKYFKK